MLFLLFQGWVVVFGSAQALPEPGLAPPSAELPSPEISSAELSSPEISPAALPPSELPVAELPAPELELEFGWMLFQTFLVLAGVVLLAYILLNWGGRRLLKMRDRGGGGRQRAISIIERVSVDARKGLLLVKVANDYFLLSNGERVLTVLSKLNAEEIEQALGRNDSNQPSAEKGLFLKKLLEKKTTQKPSEESDS